MNRATRRDLISKGASASNVEKLNSPCTITEAVQIARGVAEDVIAEYQKQTSPLQVSMSIQVEILKKLVRDAGLITEEQFHASYIEKAKEFDRLQKQSMEREDNPIMSADSSDISLEIEKKGEGEL